MNRTSDPRLRGILVCLVRHLHEFVCEARLTEDEFRAATEILNEIGQLKSDTHNEMMLMAGSLGVSSLVCLLNNAEEYDETSQSLLGPFWRKNAPRTRNGATIVRSDTPGQALFVNVRVRDRGGQPVASAEVDVWHASPVGLYENQDENQTEMNLRARFTTDATGRIWFRTVKPTGYPVPTSGVVGRLLKAQNRHPYRPAHVHFLVFKRGFKTLISQIYADDDEYLESDVQFGVTRALIGKFEEHREPCPVANQVIPPWYSLEYTFVMDRGEARLPAAPIQ
ncbi:MAG: dioxygenase [Haliea sp.]